MPDWDPEHVVSPELARALIGDQFPELAGAAIELLGEGWDNTAYLVRPAAPGAAPGPAWVVRFPRRTLGVELLEHELALLPELVPLLPLPIPDPQLRGVPGRGYPWPWWGYRPMPGAPAGDAGAVPLRADQAAPLGAFLRVLHGYPVDRARALGARGDTLARADVAARRAQWGDVPRELADAGLLDRAIADAATAVLHDTPADLPQRPDVLVHGDLYARHVLVLDGAVTGVIDWGDVHVGDPAQDLGIAFALPVAAHDAFRAAYGGIDDATWQRARFFATWHAAVVLRYAAAEAMPLVAKSARTVLTIVSTSLDVNRAGHP